MSSADIAIADLNKIPVEDAEYLISLIRTIPGYPKPEILFRDFIPVFADAKGLRILIEALQAALPVPADSFDSIAGLEARGFLFGPLLAHQLGKGFIAVRKAGKLPPETLSQIYDMEYASTGVEILSDAVKPGERVLVVDDLIATGGSAQAAAQLIERAGGTVVGFSFVMGLNGLNGTNQLGDRPTSVLTTMPDHA